MTEDADENLDRIAAAAAAAAPLLPQLKSCADIVNEILKKMGQPGYLAIGQVRPTALWRSTGGRLRSCGTV
ncbi:hypothetical protein ENH_00059390 [Eimeria necatrix]|uniref:Uncharacterized protein n=1 Tax=Eimeria necatrix TaxID=51315 RepID=U6N277_9EIME|nr:hypothetical protein ENH_00059390 [Eimeria necatrix]CDJ68874.1 hypothetical protein ENH_00059390 [Eimeria necatrix]